MGGKKHSIGFRAEIKQLDTRPTSLYRIPTRHTGPVWMPYLHWVMNNVTRKNRAQTMLFQPNNTMAGGVARHLLDHHTTIKRVTRFNKISFTSRNNR
jgi:hypothetical protein